MEQHDLFAESLTLVDQWAAASSAAETITNDGVTYWFRFREAMWHWTQERLLWRHVLADIDPSRHFQFASIPAAETALIDVAAAMGYVVEVVGQGSNDAVQVEPALRRQMARFVPASFRRAVRRVFPRPEAIESRLREKRYRILDERLELIEREHLPIVLVLSAADIYQRIGSSDGALARDPNLDSTITELLRAGLQPLVVGTGLDATQPGDWELIERDSQLFSSDYVSARMQDGDDIPKAAAAAMALDAGLGDLAVTPFSIAGVDLTGPFVEALRAQVRTTVNYDVQQLAMAERLLRRIRPQAILMTHEGHRVPWLVAGAESRVPTFTVQHGILYPTHPGYPNRRHPRLVLPSRTFVFGDYERRVLLAGAYRDEEVVVSGSPRVEAARGSLLQPKVERDRAAVRAALGVAENHRMLVISTLSLRFMQRFHFVHMLATVLGGELPNVHLVFKQHPSETDEGPYRSLLRGLAEAGGYSAPPMTVVRDIDLHLLLRAADAHLGQISTVLTDAVVDGIPNLIATVEPGGDILGYVQAGVARPVRNVHELRAALDELVPPDPEARRVFLNKHFREGPASERIAATIADAVPNRMLEPKV